MTDVGALFHELVRFETDLSRYVDARLRSEHELPLTWFHPMQLMATLPACRVYDIRAELAITIGGTSKLVDRIEAAGWCRRRANPEDRRSQIVELTPAGRRLLVKATRTFEKELKQRLTLAVSERSLDQFGATLKRLRAGNRRPAVEETSR